MQQSVADKPETRDQEAAQAPVQLAEDEFEYPDGGWTAWSQVISGHCVNAMTWGYPSTYGVYQLYYTETLGLPKAQVSWIGSIQIFIAFSLCAISGRLADAGYPRQAVLAGSLLAIFGTFMTSLTEKYWEILLAQGICTGIGLGLMFMPTISVISSYFKRRRAIALTISAAGTGTGSTVFPATVQYLTPKIGFPWAVRCAGFVALFLVIVMNLLLKPRLAPRKSGPLIEWSAFKEPTYVLFSCGCFFYFWALYFGFFYINSYARDIIGFSSTSSVSLLLITNAVGIPARPIFGWLADTFIGPVNMFFLLVSSVGCLLYGWIGVRDRAAMYAFSAVYGVAVSSSQGMFVSALASLTKDPSKMGTRFGMVCTILAFATMAGPPTAGAIIDRSGGRYVFAQIWGGTVMVLCALMIAAARVWGTGLRLFVKC
ncbi:MFS monocarboxylate transporter [Colletotrichum truncatum]|uniref:MFS monocarboxylate transporter n=1 Tax=Colletotrichum truncatum TaxID=5467 RepID=A0ACC3Z261_COLTU|nr:MFS monocarboxylate transporter [Colletotrichum truncatum]KAF6781673.1 MFS monocarboxylate transporter [Colletotrichum truncatum]